MDFLRFKEAQQLRLQLATQLTDIVQQQRAAVRGPDEAGQVMVRSGEGAATVSQALAPGSGKGPSVNPLPLIRTIISGRLF
jgi:hypothetical protein